MPFITMGRRPALITGDLKPEVPGDLCFLEYNTLMQAWRDSRRWATVHKECKRLFGFDDEYASKFLAFLEFYIREAHQYENEMVERNGNI